MKNCVCINIRLTRGVVNKYNNVCPVCRGQLIMSEETDNLYEEAVDTPPLLEGEQEKPQFSDLLSAFQNFGSVKPRFAEQVKLKIPYFDEKYKNNIKIYFLKLRNYFDTYRVSKPESQIKLLTQVLEGSALDLFLTLPKDIQSDLDTLEKVFTDHFRPHKLSHIELKQFWGTQKLPNETVSEFAVRLKIRADEIDVPMETLNAVFLNALPESYQKHIALQNVSGYQGTVKLAIEFEKTTYLTGKNTAQVLPVQSKERSDKDVEILTTMMAEFLKEMRADRDKQENRDKTSVAVRNQLDPQAKPFKYPGPNANVGFQGRRGYQQQNFGRDWRQPDRKDGPRFWRDEPRDFKRTDRDDKNHLRCFNCNKMGHFARQCRENTGNIRGRNREQFNPGHQKDSRRNFTATISEGELVSGYGLFDTLNVSTTAIRVDGNTDASNFGMGDWIWQQKKAALVNFADKEYRLHRGVGTNRDMSLFAEFHEGTRDKQWREIRSLDQDQNGNSDLCSSKFVGGEILHILRPTQEKYANKLDEARQYMFELCTRILNYANSQNFSRIWIPVCAIGQIEDIVNKESENFVLALNRGLKESIEVFHKNDQVKQLSIIVNSSKVSGIPQKVAKIIARERKGNNAWKETHRKQVDDARNQQPKILLFGDSIIKHMDKSSETRKEEWIRERIANAGMSGDKVENILWRLQHFIIPQSVRLIVIAAGTNNLFSTNVRDTVNLLRECVQYLKGKYPKVRVLVQSVLPRGSVDEGYKNKIVEINTLLRSFFSENFLDLYTDLSGVEGSFKRQYFRQDGLHLSNSGNNRYVQRLLHHIRVKEQETVAIVNKLDTWDVYFEKDSMCVAGKLEGKELEILIDTGSFVTLINEDVYLNLEHKTKQESYLTDICGLANIKQEVLGLTNITVLMGEHKMKLQCHIVKDLRYDILIGRDIMDATLHSINYRAGLLTFFKEQELLKANEGKTSIGVALEDHMLSAHSITQIRVYSPHLSGECLVAGKSDLINKGLLVQRTTVKVENHSFICFVHNVSGREVQVRASQQLVEAVCVPANIVPVLVVSRETPKNGIGDVQSPNLGEKRADIASQGEGEEVRCDRDQSITYESEQITVPVTEDANADGCVVTGSAHRKQEILQHRYRNRQLQLLLQDSDGSLQWILAKNADPGLKETYMQQHTNRYTRSGSKYSLYSYLVALCVIYMVCLVQAEAIRQPALGDIYDCENSYKEGIYAMPNELACDSNFHPSQVRKYEALVKQYKSITRVINLYHCQLKEVTKECKENFFAAKEKSRTEKTLRITVKECLRAARKKMSSYGTLVQITTTNWQTNNVREYDCRWFADRTVRYKKFELTRYPGEIQDDDIIIRQTLTQSTCITKMQHCIPAELPLSVLVWLDVIRPVPLYQPIGILVVHQIDQYVVIPKIGVGGAIIKSTDNYMLLDNTYVIEMTSNHTKDKEEEEFRNFTRRYTKETTTSVEMELLEARLGKMFMQESNMMAAIGSIMCKNKEVIWKLQNALLQHAPDIMDHYLHSETRGKILVPVGDAFLVKQCKIVRDYIVFWNHTINGTCYNLPPVFFHSSAEIKFLEIVSRRLTRTAHRVNCSDRPRDIFLRDTEGNFWKYKVTNQFVRVDMKTKHYHTGTIRLPKLATFSENSLHHSRNLPHRLNLLTLLAHQRENLQELEDIRDLGRGSIIEGMTEGIGNILKTLTGSGLKLVKGVASGLKTVVNETTSVVAQTISGFGHILSFTGGYSGFFLYVIDVLIIGYLIWSRYWDGNVHNRQIAELHERERQIRRILRGEIREGDIGTTPPIRSIDNSA